MPAFSLASCCNLPTKLRCRWKQNEGQSCSFLSVDMFLTHEHHPIMIIAENWDNYTVVLLDFWLSSIGLIPTLRFLSLLCKISVRDLQRGGYQQGQAGSRPGSSSASGVHVKFLIPFQDFCWRARDPPSRGPGCCVLGMLRGAITSGCQHFPWLCGEGSVAFMSSLKYVRSHL